MAVSRRFVSDDVSSGVATVGDVGGVLGCDSCVVSFGGDLLLSGSEWTVVGVDCVSSRSTAVTPGRIGFFGGIFRDRSSARDPERKMS